MGDAPHERRPFGWLKHGNPPGDFRSAPRCGARNRRGTPCRCPAMANGRCRLHGGLSTGAKMLEGRERARMANYKHGFYTAQMVAERRRVRQLFREFRSLLARL